MFIIGGFRQVLKIGVGGRCSESTSQCALVLGESDVRKNGLCSQHVFLLRCLLMGSSSAAVSALWHRRGLELFPTSLLCSWLSSRWWDLQTAASSNSLFFDACSDQVDQNSGKCLWQISRLECLQWNAADSQHPAPPRRPLLLQGREWPGVTGHQVHTSGRVL